MSTLLAFVSCADEPAIVTFAFDRATGALAERARTAVPGPPGANMSMPLAFSPDRRTLHAATRQAPFRCTSFAVAPDTGALREIGGADLPESMAYILVAPGGGHLLAASYPGALVSSTAIAPSGAVTGPPVQIIDTPPRAHAIVAHRGQGYVPCLGGDVVLQLALDPATGHMTQVGRLKTHPGSGPRHMRFSPDGRHAYILGELDARLIACTVAADGALTAIQTVPTLPPGYAAPADKRIMAADLQITPDGRFLYASERLSETVSAWRISADGTLAAIGTVATEPMPRALAIDPAGRFLFCASQTAGTLRTHAIDPTSGALTLTATTPAGANANWIEFFQTT